MTRFNPVTKVIQAFFLLAIVVFVLRKTSTSNEKTIHDWRVSRWLNNPSGTVRQKDSFCDPYGEFGHLFTADKLHDSRYIIYNDHRLPNSDAPREDWIVPSLSASIHEHKFVELDFLTNRTVLMIGDSIDRNLVTHFGRRALAGTRGGHKFFEPPESFQIAQTKLESHKIGMAYLPELNFTIYNWFLMGLSVQNEVPFYHPREDLPQKFEKRLDTFFFPLLKFNLIPKPDLIIFNTGFWDLEYLARSRLAKFNLPDVKPREVEGPTGLKLNNLGDGNPLSLTELAYHRIRVRKFLRLLISFLKTVYEEHDSRGGKEDYRDIPVEIMYRSMQLGNASLTNAFAAERIHQLEESNRMVVKEFGIRVFEWGKMTIGLDTQLDDPSVHYGIGSAQYIFGDMLLFYLKQLVSESGEEWMGCEWIRRRKQSYYDD